MIRAVAFDFDGVLVETVDVKTRAFSRLFGDEPSGVVAQIVEYHRQHGGVSRFEKFRTIYRDILRRPLSESEFQRLCDAFSGLVMDEVVAAPWVEGAETFLTAYRSRYLFLVISGTPDDELRVIMARRSISQLFDDVLGSPRTKEVLLGEAMARHRLTPPEVVFVGDAPTDWAAAQQVGIPFIWRRTPDIPFCLPGFSGPSMSTLRELPACLSALEAHEVPSR